MVRPSEMRGSQLIGLSLITPRAIALDMREAVSGKFLNGGVQPVHEPTHNSLLRLKRRSTGNERVSAAIKSKLQTALERHGVQLSEGVRPKPRR
jgi:hypothetical protein